MKPPKSLPCPVQIMFCPPQQCQIKPNLFPLFWATNQQRMTFSTRLKSDAFCPVSVDKVCLF